MANKYKTDLIEALRDLDSMVADEQELAVRIARQKKKVAALTELANDEEEVEGPTGLVDGITDACRTVLMAAEKPLTPAEVRDRIEALGLPPQKNLLASVHTILRRFAKADDAHVNEIRTGDTVEYRWVQTLPSYLQSVVRNSLLMETLLAERQAAANRKK